MHQGRRPQRALSGHANSLGALDHLVQDEPRLATCQCCPHAEVLTHAETEMPRSVLAMDIEFLGRRSPMVNVAVGGCVGEKKPVTIDVPIASLAIWDGQAMTVEATTYTVEVGASAGDLPLKTSFTVTP